MRTLRELDEHLAHGQLVYSSDQACRLTGCTYRQLDYWCRNGIITPYRNARGSGTQRLFDRANIRDLWIITRLAAVDHPYHLVREHGPADAARLLVDQLRLIVDDLATV